MVMPEGTEVLYSKKKKKKIKRTRENEILVILNQQCSIWEFIITAVEG